MEKQAWKLYGNGIEYNVENATKMIEIALKYHSFITQIQAEAH